MGSHKWGHLEMHMLLSEDITEFNVDSCKDINKDKNKRSPDLLVSLLISRCPVGPGGGGGVRIVERGE